MRYFWGSDLHLDHLNASERVEFLERVTKMCDDPDSTLLLTGDITQQSTLWEHLDALAQASRGRMLYVLGNHDYWGGSFAQAYMTLRPHGLENGHAVFMDSVDRVQLESDLCVVGDSGWYDGRNGTQGPPRFIMNDWYYITEYRANHGMTERQFSARVADARAAVLDRKLRAAIEAGNKRIVILTHCPPWVETCRYMGRPSDEHALPWFSSRVIADTVDQVVNEHPDVNFELLCGHTHDGYKYRRTANLNVKVSGAEYGAPYVREWNPSLW